jgi:signal transduction histidine kinase
MLLAGEIELALDSPQATGEMRNTLVRLQRDTQRLVHLSEDLLTVSGAGATQPCMLRVRGVVASVVARHRNTPHAIANEVDDAVAVYCDPGHLDRAISNMLHNAIVHGGPNVTVRATPDRDATVIVSVQDDGPGFPHGFEAHAFERFARADRSRSGPGAGLGLAIVNALATANNGTAGATTPPAGGATVWIRLPAR